MRSRSLHSLAVLGALAAAGVAAAYYPSDGPPMRGFEPPRAPRRGPSTDDLSRIAAAQAKRERRAARNRSRL